MLYFVRANKVYSILSYRRGFSSRFVLVKGVSGGRSFAV